MSVKHSRLSPPVSWWDFRGFSHDFYSFSFIFLQKSSFWTNSRFLGICLIALETQGTIYKDRNKKFSDFYHKPSSYIPQGLKTEKIGSPSAFSIYIIENWPTTELSVRGLYKENDHNMNTEFTIFVILSSVFIEISSIFICK